MIPQFILSVVAVLAGPNGVSREAFDRLEFGMTRQQVEFILGGPALGKAATVDREYNARTPRCGTINSLHVQMEGDLWCSGADRIWVVFDEHDRVTGMMFGVERASDAEEAE